MRSNRTVSTIEMNNTHRWYFDVNDEWMPKPIDIYSYTKQSSYCSIHFSSLSLHRSFFCPQCLFLSLSLSASLVSIKPTYCLYSVFWWLLFIMKVDGTVIMIIAKFVFFFHRTLNVNILPSRKKSKKKPRARTSKKENLGKAKVKANRPNWVALGWFFEKKREKLSVVSRFQTRSISSRETTEVSSTFMNVLNAAQLQVFLLLSQRISFQKKERKTGRLKMPIDFYSPSYLLVEINELLKREEKAARMPDVCSISISKAVRTLSLSLFYF